MLFDEKLGCESRSVRSREPACSSAGRRLVYLKAAGTNALASTGWRSAQTAHEMARVLIRFTDKHTTAICAARHDQHVVDEKLGQQPGPRHRQFHIHGEIVDLLCVKAISLDKNVDIFFRACLAQIDKDVGKQGCMNIWLPRQEPVCRVRQLTLRG